MEKQKVSLGTELKLNIHIDPIQNISMEDYGFEVEAFCNSRKSVVVTKQKALRVDKDNYLVMVDTNLVGTGELKLRVTAYIPDLDFEDNLRTEVAELNTGITINRMQ